MSFQAVTHALSLIDTTVAAALVTLAVSFTLSLTSLVKIAAQSLNQRHITHQHGEERHAC